MIAITSIADFIHYITHKRDYSENGLRGKAKMRGKRRFVGLWLALYGLAEAFVFLAAPLKYYPPLQAWDFGLSANGIDWDDTVRRQVEVLRLGDGLFCLWGDELF